MLKKKREILSSNLFVGVLLREEARRTHKRTEKQKLKFDWRLA